MEVTWKFILRENKTVNCKSKYALVKIKNTYTNIINLTGERKKLHYFRFAYFLLVKKYPFANMITFNFELFLLIASILFL